MKTRIIYKGYIGNARAEAFDVAPENMVVLETEEIVIDDEDSYEEVIEDE